MPHATRLGLSRNGSKNITVNSAYCSGLPSHQISIQLSICGMRWSELFRVEVHSQPTWHNCRKHWKQHGPVSLWNAFDESRLFWGQRGVQLNIRKVFLMFCTLSVYARLLVHYAFIMLQVFKQK
jgi:hypothetical protein